MHLYACMSTKTITLSQDAYDLLAGLKEAHESFSDVIRRRIAKKSITEFAGILTREEGKRVEQLIQQGRAHSLHRAKRIRKLLT